MRAEIKTERRLVCPECGYDEAMRIDHLTVGFAFGPWGCNGCGLRIGGTITADGAEITIEPGPRDIPALMLLRIAGSTPPVFMVVSYTIWSKQDEAHDYTYFVEEHTCPTNLVEVEAILWDGDADPHGVLEFVQIVPKPPSWHDTGNYADYAALFDQLPGQLIEGSVAAPKSLPGPA